MPWCLPWTAVIVSTKQSWRWPPIRDFTPMVTRLGCLRGVSTFTAFGLAVEIGDWQRLSGRSIGAYLGLVPTENSSGADTLPGRRHQDRQRPRPPPAGRSGLASPHPGTGPGANCGSAGRRRPRQPERGARQPTSVCTPAGWVSMHARNVPWSLTPRSPVNWPAGAGRWPSSTTNTPRTSGEQLGGDGKRLGVTRGRPMSNHVAAQLDDARPLDKRSTPTRKFRPAVTNPRISD